MFRKDQGSSWNVAAKEEEEEEEEQKEKER
jgi:hypothetical protein